MQDGSTQAQQENLVSSWLASVPRVDKWELLSETDQTLLLVYKLDGQACNGGFHQFFFNPHGDKWRETESALAKIAAKRIAGMFWRALTVFPGGTPSVDHLTRARQLGEIDKDGKQLLEELTDEYYDLYRDHTGEEMFTKMYYYLKGIPEGARAIGGRAEP